MRRWAILPVALAACGTASPVKSPGRPPGAPTGLAAEVNAFIGTADGAPDYGIHNAAGDTFPGAVYPFGMVQWSPDTTGAPGGYRYGDHLIRGFSLTHFSGRGLSCYQDVPFLPTFGPLSAFPASPFSGVPATFSHAAEAAWPGFYGVRLDDGIEVDLTVTPRTGLARLTWPAGSQALLLVNAGGSANGDEAIGTSVEIRGDDEVVGEATSGNCGNPFLYTVYFAARFDRPFTAFGTFQGPQVSAGSRQDSGAGAGAYLSFDVSSNPTVLAKVGLSFVSTDGAEANLAAEDPGWDFAAIGDAATAAWNDRLGRIAVTGGTPDERAVFYTALYHAQIHPSLFSDADGRYLGFDGVVHAGARPHYHNFATWDSYRSEMPLLAMIDPVEASDMAQSLVEDAAQDPGGGLPRWEQAAANSGVMLGDSPDAVLASLYAFGATDFDAHTALAEMVRGASRPGVTSGGYLVREGLAGYLARGWVGADEIDRSASRTLEYATDDFSISRLADALGEPSIRDAFLLRSHAWRNLFDPAAGYLVPRDSSGAFEPGGPTDENGFAESDAAQYLWMVPFDLAGLCTALGGDAAAVARLDRHFTRLDDGPTSEYAFLGNEPESKAPWVYDFAGAPWRTQEVVRRAVTTLYANTPGGMPGNDDGGAMGSWVVFAELGLFPEIPAVGGLVADSPLFPSAAVALAGGTLTIDAPGASAAQEYVQALTIDGAPWGSPWIPWARIATGGVLRFTLGPAPNTAWGGSPSAAPPSFE